MKVTIDIECTPQEARAFFGLPDVEPLNRMLLEEMTTRAKDNIDTLADPERFVAQWLQMSGKGMDAFQGLFGAAMKAGSTTAKK